MIDLSDLRELMEQGGDQILSLYLRVDAGIQKNQSQTRGWRIYAKNSLKELDGQIKDERRGAWENIHKQAERYLNGYTSGSKGLVLFFGPDFERIYELPIPPHENAHHFGRPLLAPLLWLIDEYERYLIVLVDSEEAHFLDAYLGDVGRQEAMASDRFMFDFGEKSIMPRPRGTQPDVAAGNVTAGSHRDEFADKMDEYIAKFHRDVAERIREMLFSSDANRVILGGNEKAAHAVRDFLHEQIRNTVVGVFSIPLQESDQEIMKRVLPEALKFEREQEMKLIDEVVNFAKAGGRGALGHNDVMDALKMQQVETLIAPWPSDDEKRLHDMTLQALKSNAVVELVHGEAAEKLRQHADVAARLYYAIQEED